VNTIDILKAANHWRDDTMHTPWGPSQHAKTLMDGIIEVSTASHGGIKLDRTKNAQVPDYMRRKGGWYEEDCDWCIPALLWPEAFSFPTPEEAHDNALHTFKTWMPDEAERYLGIILQPGESHVKDERAWKLAHANDYLVLAGYGSWHDKVPHGFVGVFAGRGGRLPNGSYPNDTAWFLVPEDEYKQPGRFVIDPTRHQTVQPFD
jgi:hypothetical protein